MSLEKGLKAVDHSHHLSEIAKARKPSPIKGLMKYMLRPDMLSLAGGLPSPSYFPFAEIRVDALAEDSFSIESSERSSTLSWLWNIFSSNKSINYTVPKYPAAPGAVNLAAALQYDSTEGMVQLRKIIREFTARVYQPAYSDWQVVCHTGNTDGWTRVVQTLCNPGDYILAEEWTFPSALATANPTNVLPVPIAVDGIGMRPDDLRKVLAEWDESARGAKRPHVMYTIPVGQNPTGSTMNLARKKEIYDICVEYDVIIAEDDPYYFLQMQAYVPKADRHARASAHPNNPDEYIANLAPSFVRVDYQGRVIRLDTFSKTIAPGSRLGWFTCSPVFAERLLRYGEVTIQAPCGLGQALITQLLTTWKYDGYIRWLQGLGREYSNRRDFLVDSLSEVFHLRSSSSTLGFWQGCNVYDAYLTVDKSSEKSALGDTRLFSFVAPTAGMFIWIKFYFDSYPALKSRSSETLEMQLFIKLAEEGVLFAPGWMFGVDQDNIPGSETEGHYRISFSNAEYPNMRKAIEIFAKVCREFSREISVQN